MNKKLLYFFSASISLIVLSNSSFGQTAASGTWSLLADQTVVVSGSVTAVGQTLGSTIVGTQYGNGTYGTSGSTHNTGYQRVGNSPGLPQNAPDLTNGYIDYKVAPTAGKDLKIQAISFAAVGGGSGLVRIVVQYSKDGGATFSDMPVSVSYNSANYAATTAEPIVLINGGSTSADFAGAEIATFSNLSIVVPDTKTFVLRMYPYTAASSNKYLADKDILITGVTGAPGTLPLDFLSFTAKSDAFGKTVSLNWSTTNEVNTKNFEIQRRTDGSDFVTIGTLASKNVAGTHNYSFTDNSAVSGNSYYRIVQYDNDGASTISKIQAVTTNTSAGLSIYPNPTASILSISHSLAEAGANAKVIGMDGKTVLQQALGLNSTETKLDVSQLTPGNYLLILDNRDQKSSLKFVKQ